MVVWESHRRPKTTLPHGGKPGSYRLDGCRDSNEQMARETVSSSGIAVSVSESAWGDMSPVVQGSINDTSEKPLSRCRWVRQNCTCHSCSPS